MSSKVDLRQMFKGLQTQMIAQLNANRDILKHSGTKGESLENAWIEWLRTYLPSRYCVNRAIIIDCKGQLSDQIDVVVYDQHFTPFMFKQNGVYYIPAEGVYAVFEVKPVINKFNIKYASDKVASVRKLHRTSTNMIDRGRKTNPRGLTKIVGGILAIDNTISKNKTREHLKNTAKSGLGALDMGCAMTDGSFIVDYEEVKPIEFGDEKDVSTQILNDRIKDFYDHRTIEEIRFSFKNNSLVSFFLQFTRYLQQSIGTVAAINLSTYAEAISFEIDEEL